MAINKAIHDRILDPYQRGLFGDNNNIYSNVMLSHEANRILEIIDNDSVLSGLKVKDYFLQNNNREIRVKLTSGRLIQDRTLIDILDTSDLVLPIFTEYEVVGVSTEDNYFVFSNDVRSDFETLTDFAIINSTGNDKNDWTVEEATYDSVANETTVYVSGNVTDSTEDGKAVCRKYIDSYETVGHAVIYTEYQFLEDFRDYNYPLKLKIDYLDRDNHVDRGWNSGLNRVVFALIYFERNNDNTEILPDSLKNIKMVNTVNVEGIEYRPRRVTTIVDVADAGNIV